MSNVYGQACLIPQIFECMRPLIPNRNPVQRICHSIEMPKHDNTKEKGVALVFPNIMFYGENIVEMVRPVIN